MYSLMKSIVRYISSASALVAGTPYYYFEQIALDGRIIVL